MRYGTRFIVALAALLAAAGGACGQTAPLAQFDVRLDIDSGYVQNAGDSRGVIFSEIIHVPEATWLRLDFDDVTLGQEPAGGEPTVIRMTSIFDGGLQHLNRKTLYQWQYTSAYFNGHTVLLELIADPGAAPSRVTLNHAWAGVFEPGQPETICGPTDDRLPSFDPAVGRALPVGCTAWMINDANHCFLTAGHCSFSLEVIEFNVPLSSPSGSINHPGPEDQYAVDPASHQTNGGQGAGDDWAYFGCFPNSQTGWTPYQAQGAFFVLAFPPPVQGQDIRITGYGTVSSPISPTWNQIQKTHVGPYWELVGTLVRYRTDTTGGNSGSPVILEQTGEAIGIHGQTGCTSTGGSNRGCGVNHTGLQDALANPQGVCIPAPPICPADVNEDLIVDVLDLLQVLAAWGNTSGPEDINGDGIVDVLDLLELLAAWGPCPGPPWGACCLGDGTCVNETAIGCLYLNGIWYEGEDCATFVCPPPPLGACCFYPSGDCQDLNQWECAQADGNWQGPGTDCATTTCPVPPPGDVIEDAIEIPTLPYNTTGNTEDYNHDYDEVCPYSGSMSKDVVYAYVPSANELVLITLCADSQYDTKLYVYENGYTPGAPFACNDDECTTPGGQSWVSELSDLSLTGGNTYYIVIDGYGSQNGFYTLDIEVGVDSTGGRPSG